jgi:phosphoglycolate phosphatase
VALNLIIFDLDGTLADTLQDTAEAVNEVFRQFNIPAFSTEEIRAVMAGEDSRLRKILFEGQKAGIDLRMFAVAFSRAYSARLAVHTTLYPGVEETLRQLPVRQKAVISNKSESLTVAVLDHFGILRCFDAVTGGDSGVGRKPSPAPILHMLSRLNANPDETLIMGDCVLDIEAGRTAGIRTIAATYGYGNNHFAHKADFVVDAFPQVLDIVNQLK